MKLFRRKLDKEGLLSDNKLEAKRLTFVIAWFFCYLLCFFLLEGRTFAEYNIISSELDKLIPFKPEFIYVYLFWFPYVAVFFIWFSCISKSKNSEQITKLMLWGTTLFLIISWFYPNGLNFREYLFYEKGTLSGILVQILHTIDTPTNVFPSMHVFMTAAIQVGVENEAGMKQNKALLWFTRVTAVLIILSTVFLKQHSIIDVCGGLLLVAILYWKIYYWDER